MIENFSVVVGASRFRVLSVLQLCPVSLQQSFPGLGCLPSCRDVPSAFTRGGAGRNVFSYTSDKVVVDRSELLDLALSLRTMLGE